MRIGSKEYAIAFVAGDNIIKNIGIRISGIHCNTAACAGSPVAGNDIVSYLCMLSVGYAVEPYPTTGITRYVSTAVAVIADAVRVAVADMKALHHNAVGRKRNACYDHYVVAVVGMVIGCADVAGEYGAARAGRKRPCRPAANAAGLKAAV